MKKFLSDYITNVLRNLGLAALALSAFVSLFGEQAKDITPLAALGSAGITVRVMLQMLLANLIAVALARLFLSETVIKDMKPGLRVILATGSAFLTVLVCILAFGWIPLHEKGGIAGFICFVCCFLICFVSRAVLFLRREKQENQRLADALDRYKSARA